MNIALMHYRVLETDGVSLEMEKWKTVLESLGHHVSYIAASENELTHTIDALNIRSEKHKKLFHNAYVSFDDYASEDDFMQVIQDEANFISKALCDIIDNANLDMLIINNIGSLGLHLPAGVAVANLHKKRTIKIAYHHHDFYWERARYHHPTTEGVKNLLKTVFPPRDQSAKHFVINKIAQNALFERKGLKATVVPNVFDFSQDPWVVDDYNRDMRARIGISDDDIVLLQATRIEDRKAIEFAVDLTAYLSALVDNAEGDTLYNGKPITKDITVHLVIAGMPEMDPKRHDTLVNHCKAQNIHVHFINDMIGASRKASPNKIYSLWDAYTMCDAVTYPSILEGWGNQFIEAIFAKKPVVAFEYPVFKTDILPLGFKVISLGDSYKTRPNGLYQLDENIINQAAQSLFKVLRDHPQYHEMVEHNAQIGKRTLSYNTLSKLLSDTLFDWSW